MENDPTILTASDSSVHMLGFCTGLLPGTVAAFARDTSEIFRFGSEIVAISFRLAIEFTRRSKRIEESPKSWARTVVGATAEELQAILDDFNQSQVSVPRRSHTLQANVTRASQPQDMRISVSSHAPGQRSSDLQLSSKGSGLGLLIWPSLQNSLLLLIPLSMRLICRCPIWTKSLEHLPCLIPLFLPQLRSYPRVPASPLWHQTCGSCFI